MTKPEANREAVARTILRAVRVSGADKLEFETTVNGVLHLHGHLERWDDLVTVGHSLAEHAAVGDFACHVTTRDGSPRPPAAQPASDYAPVGPLPASAEVVVVGAGIVGLAVARGLVQAGYEVVVLEAGQALGTESTSWNNGMIHSGFDPRPGTVKASLNLRGNALWPALARELDIPMLRNGSLLIGRDENETKDVKVCFDRAMANGVPGAELIDGRRTLEIAPETNPETKSALWTPSAGFIDSVEATLAMADDVRANGGAIVLRAPVTSVDVTEGAVRGVCIPDRAVSTGVVINAAGVRADEIAAMAGCQSYSIHPRRGTLVLFDEGAGPPSRPAIGFPSHRYTKGGGMTPRPSGQMVGGPTAFDQNARHAPAPTADEVEEIMTRGRALLPGFPFGKVISIGSGLRAATFSEDFVIGPAPGVSGFFDVAGMQSPGVASIPAVVERVLAQVRTAGFHPWSRTAPFVTRADRRDNRAATAMAR